MKAITIRNIPPEVARAIRKKAEAEGTSLNRAVLGLIDERLGTNHKKRTETRHHDLDFLAGSWTQRDAEVFDNSLAEQRAIDPEVWK